MVGEVLLDPGDISLVAAPTYFVFLSVLSGLGARAIPVDADDQGMRLDLLEEQLARLDAAGELPRVKLIYVVSYYENPSGISLSEERRQRVVEIARRWSKDQRIFVLEDAAYRDLRYDGTVHPSVWSFDAERETVIFGADLLQEFFTRLACRFRCRARFPGPADLRSQRKRGLWLGPFQSADHDGRVGKRPLRIARRACAGVVSEQTRPDVGGGRTIFPRSARSRWVRPEGGLYVWMTLPPGVETGFDSALFKRAAKVDGVMYVPGELSYAGALEERRRSQMRLSFGVETPDRIEEGMRRLAAAVRAVL